MKVDIRDHHQRAIQKLTERYRDDPAFDALIVAGSVAKGTARDDSDLDVLFVATDEEYARRRDLGELAFILGDVCDYPGGYVDSKVLDRSFLEDAAAFGSEPARNAFIGAFPAISRIDDLETLIRRIPVYQECERQPKIESFYSQIALNRGFFWNEAEMRADPYLKHRVASDLVLFGGRLILTHNRILFPCHKRLMEFVAAAPERPDDFASLAEELLSNPSRESVDRFCACIDQFANWDIRCDMLARYIEDSEQTWRTRVPSLADS